MIKTALTKKEIVDVLRANGLEMGMIVEVHCSLSSTGYIVGGAQTLVDALMEYFGKSNKEATEWAKQIYKELEFEKNFGFTATNKPGPQDGTGINPQKKGSETGLNNPAGQQNRTQDNNAKSSQLTE